MAIAYATIANGGRQVEPTVISRVVRTKGKEGRKGPLRGANRTRGRAGPDARGGPQGDRDHDRRRHPGHRRGGLPRRPAGRRQDRDEGELLRRVVPRLHPAAGDRCLDGLRGGRADPGVRSGVRRRATASGGIPRPRSGRPTWSRCSKANPSRSSRAWSSRRRRSTRLDPTRPPPTYSRRATEAPSGRRPSARDRGVYGAPQRRPVERDSVQREPHRRYPRACAPSSARRTYLRQARERRPG